MATSTPSTKETSSVLSKIGGFFKKVFTDVDKVAVAVEPEINLAFPGISTLYDTTVAELSNVLTDTSDETSLTQVAATIAADFQKYANQVGIPEPSSAQILAWVQAVSQSVSTFTVAPAASPSVTQPKLEVVKPVPVDADTVASHVVEASSPSGQSDHGATTASDGIVPAGQSEGMQATSQWIAWFESLPTDVQAKMKQAAQNVKNAQEAQAKRDAEKEAAK